MPHVGWSVFILSVSAIVGVAAKRLRDELPLYNMVF